MSLLNAQCPDWRNLAAMRRDPAAGEAADARWNEALDHASGCADCGPRAAASDPLALLRPLRQDIPTLEDEVDVERMRISVEALRRGQRTHRETRLTGTSWMRYAAAAAFAVMLVSLGVVDNGTGVGEDSGPPAPSITAAVPSAGAVEPMPWTDPLDAFAEPMDAYAEQPVFDDLQRPAAASVYQLAEDDLHVVMVVHETLDV
ncbi:MAG: hypothetical protein AAF481_18300 [Acidobacteriota bacterium]